MKSSTMKNQSFIYRFLVRWLVCSLGLWISAAFLGSHITYNGSLGVIIWAGFFLAIINAILKPILVIFSLPAILLTLGLFMIIINGFTVYLVSHIYTSLQVTSFWSAVLAGMIIGLVNYLVTAILENRES